ncbi:hypothetical protein ACS5PN_21255 [Roseateles sp. NT4]|uniref:hypothetical protein n=1 Tax=Roseateles sp. NT4 TaxID=3453715 RepID=UPI003EED7CF1
MKKRTTWHLGAAGGVLLLAGCSAMMVPASDNPVVKVNQADSLYGLVRPIPATALLREAIPMLEAKQDQLWLGHAYRTYADFADIATRDTRYSGYFVSVGPLRAEDRFDGPKAAAQHYYGKALASYKQAEAQSLPANQPGTLVNIYFNGAIAALKTGDLATSCEMSGKALPMLDRLDAEDSKRPTKQQYSERHRVLQLRKDAKCA